MAEHLVINGTKYNGVEKISVPKINSGTNAVFISENDVLSEVSTQEALIITIKEQVENLGGTVENAEGTGTPLENNTQALNEVLEGFRTIPVSGEAAVVSVSISFADETGTVSDEYTGSAFLITAEGYANEAVEGHLGANNILQNSFAVVQKGEGYGSFDSVYTDGCELVCKTAEVLVFHIPAGGYLADMTIFVSAAAG